MVLLHQQLQVILVFAFSLLYPHTHRATCMLNALLRHVWMLHQWRHFPGFLILLQCWKFFCDASSFQGRLWQRTSTREVVVVVVVCMGLRGTLTRGQRHCW